MSFTCSHLLQNVFPPSTRPNSISRKSPTTNVIHCKKNIRQKVHEKKKYALIKVTP